MAGAQFRHPFRGFPPVQLQHVQRHRLQDRLQRGIIGIDGQRHLCHPRRHRLRQCTCRGRIEAAGRFGEEDKADIGGACFYRRRDVIGPGQAAEFYLDIVFHGPAVPAGCLKGSAGFVQDGEHLVLALVLVILQLVHLAFQLHHFA